MKTTYLFDFDGVLADSGAYYLAGLNHALTQAGVETRVSADTLANLRHLSFENLIDSVVLDANTRGLCLIYLAQYLREQPPRFAPYAGVKAVLAQAAADGDVFIISLSETDIIRQFLVKHGLSASVNAVFGGDLRGDKISKITTLVERRELDPASVVVIGDAASDIDAARVCGVSSVAALWGWQPELSKAAKPTAVAASPAALGETLAMLRPSSAMA